MRGELLGQIRVNSRLGTSQGEDPDHGEGGLAERG